LIPAIRYLDHASAWRRPDGETLLRGEPYELRGNSLADLAALIDAGFAVAITSAESAWFPSRTMAVRITGPALDSARPGRLRQSRPAARAFIDRGRRPWAVAAICDEAVSALASLARDFGSTAVEEAFNRVAAPAREAMAFRGLQPRPELLGGDGLSSAAGALGSAFGGLRAWTDADGRAVLTAEGSALDGAAIVRLGELAAGGCELWLSPQHAFSNPAGGLFLSVVLPGAALPGVQEAA
jgi:hypothetical protein